MNDVAPTDDVSAADGLDGLQAQLASAEENSKHQNDEINEHIDNADVMLKLMLMCGVPDVAASDCDDYSSLVCRLMCGHEATDYGDGTSDAAVIRDFVKCVCDVLGSAINPDATNEQAMMRHTDLNIAMADMMRTATLCLLPGDIQARREYTRSRRSSESQKNGELWNLIRGGFVTPESHTAYVTAEAMSENFDCGVRALEALQTRSEDELLMFVNTSIPHLKQNLECMAFATLFDGQRLRAGITIAARIYGRSEGDYGVNFVARHLLNANQSAISLYRVQTTFCAFLAMANVHIISAMGDGWSQHMGIPEVVQFPFTKMLEALQSTINEDGARRETAASITYAVECIADWFEMAVHDDAAYYVVHSAFQSPVLVLGEACETLVSKWQAFCVDQNVKAVNLWTAAQFLITARMEMDDTSMPISTAVHVVLSGLVGNLMSFSGITGPFVLCYSCTVATARFYKGLPKVDFKIPESDVYGPDGRSKSPTRNGSRDCKATKITKSIRAKGHVRSQHEKGRLVDTRLSASFPFLSIKEALMRDLPEGVSASTTEGRKDLRRIYIKYLQTNPSCKHTWCLHTDHASYLIERKRTGDDGRTTSKNVQNPWRDVLGASILGTLYHPIAGEAFVRTLDELDESFESNTNACVDTFAIWMEFVSDLWFSPEYAMYEAPDRLEGREYANRIFAQQRSLVRAICKVIKMDTGTLWDAMQQIFATHVAAKGEEDELDSDSIIGGGLPDIPPLPIPLPELPQPNKQVPAKRSLDPPKSSSGKKKSSKKMEDEPEEPEDLVTESDGFQLYLNSKSCTGYTGVTRNRRGSFRVRVPSFDTYHRGRNIGTYNTAVKAAVAYARHMDSFDIAPIVPDMPQIECLD
jgi:hypothetical protein